MGEIKSKMGGGQKQDMISSTSTQHSSPTRPDTRRSRDGRPSQSGRGQDNPSGQGRETTAALEDEDDDEEEENGEPQDPYASERAALGESGDNGVTMEAIHNKNRLQAKMMGLQGEALRLTYAIDHINSWPAEWQQKREDLKRAVRAHSSQLQFAVKRAERALLAKIEEGGRDADHRFMRAAELGKQRLRDSLRNVLHEVNVLKGLRELGMDAEVNTMCAFLLARSVGMEEVGLDMPTVELEGLGQKESEIHDIVARSFGDLVFSERRTDVFKPEPVDFSQIPVENFVSKVSIDEQSVIKGISAEATETEPSNVTIEVSAATTPDGDTPSPEEAPVTGERRPRKRSTADKRRHMTDLGLDTPGVREYLAQFQTARETFRARRREILQQGQLGRVSAASSARAGDSSEWGLDAFRARLRSSSREGGRIQSVDRGHPQLVPTGVPVSEIPALMRRRGSAPVMRSSSMSRLTTVGQTAGPLPAAASKYLSTGIVGKPPPSPVTEEGGSASASREGTSDADFYHSLVSPQLPRRQAPRERRHSIEAVQSLEDISIPAAAELLTQGETSESGAGWVSSRPIRRAISSGADKRAKIEILRETWHRRKEILIQNEGFVTSDSPGSPRQGSPVTGSPRQGSESADSPRQISSPPVSPGAGQEPQQDAREKKAARKVLQQEATGLSSQHQLQHEIRAKETAGLVSRLAEISHSPAASSYGAMYSSHGGPAAHLVNTVKISIPEVNERTSPIPEPLKTSTLTAVETDTEFKFGFESSKSDVTAVPLEHEGIDSMATDESVTTSQEPLPVAGQHDREDHQEEEDEKITTDTFVVPLPASSTEKVATDTFTFPSSATSSEATPIATETTETIQESPPKTTQEVPTNPTPAAPTYFFKSRLTGLPVGGTAASRIEVTEPAKPTYFFKSRLTGLPVGGPVTATPKTTSSAVKSTTASTTTADVRSSSKTMNSTVTFSTPIPTTAPVTPKLIPESEVLSTKEAGLAESSRTSSFIPSSAKITSVDIDQPPAKSTPCVRSSYMTNEAAEVALPIASSRYTNNTTIPTTSSVTAPVSNTFSDRKFAAIGDSVDVPDKSTSVPSTSVLKENSSSFDKSKSTVETITAADSSAATSSTTAEPARKPWFRSRLTGLPVGGPTEPTVNAPVSTAPPTSVPFFKSRLTGQPVGRVTTSEVNKPDSSTPISYGSVTATHSETLVSTATTTTRYPTRYSTESMFGSKEGEITNTTTSSQKDNSASTATSSSANSGSVKRELPPLRSAPAFSYTRRYNMSSSSSSHSPSAVTSSEDSTREPNLTQGGEKITSYGGKLTSTAPLATGLTTSNNYSAASAYRYGNTFSQRDVGTPQTVSRYGSGEFSEPQKLYGFSEDGRGTAGGIGLTAGSGEAAAFHLHKLDYPRAHLPDVIPETTIELTPAKEISIRAPETKEEVTTRAYVASTSEASKSTTAADIRGSPGAAKTNEEVKKSLGYDVDSEISRGISITDAIRRSSSPLTARFSPATARRAGVPEPLDLQIGATARSPTGVVGSKEVPSPRSPIPSPSSPTPAERGIKGRLKEIARKKKERWRHLTIH